MSSDDKIASRTGGVEVVADQGDDGSFEIRMERQGETGPVTAPIPVEEKGAWRAEAATLTAPTRGPSKVLIWGGAGLGVAVLLGGIMLLSSSPAQLNGNRPKTVSVSSEPQFRGYMVEGRSPARASNLRLEFGAQQDGSSDENSFDYDQNPPEAAGIDLSPTTGSAAVPSSTGGAARGQDVDVDDEEADPFAGMTRLERNEAGRQMLFDAVEEQLGVHRRNKAQEAADEPAPELIEPQFEDEALDEFGYENEFDEDYDLYE